MANTMQPPSIIARSIMQGLMDREPMAESARATLTLSLDDEDHSLSPSEFWDKALKAKVDEIVSDLRQALMPHIELKEPAGTYGCAILDWGPYRVRVLPIYDGESDQTAYRIDVTYKVAEKETIA